MTERHVSRCSDGGPTSLRTSRQLKRRVRTSFRVMFVSLDFIYVPTEDVDDSARRYVDELGAELI